MCLTLSQALWLLHRVAHVGQVGHVGQVAHVAHGGHLGQSTVSTRTASVALEVGAWTKALLPDHKDERSCAQYDQLSHADMAPGCHALHATLARNALAQVTHVASSMAAQAAGFLARGPPAIA